MERKILSKEDIDMLTKMLDALKENTPKKSLSFNLLDGILEFLTNEEKEAEAVEEIEKEAAEIAETEIRKKWGWSPERRAKQLKNLAKKAKAKKLGAWNWSPERKEKQRLSMKKAWAKRKKEEQQPFDISKAFK